MADAYARHDVTDGDVTERWYNGDGDELVLLAPHGGNIEPGTATQASTVATEHEVACWTCTAHSETDESAFSRFHITSSQITPARFPLLERAYGREPSLAVSFHGMSESGVKVGGRAPTPLKQRVCAQIQTVLPDSTLVEAVSWGPYSGATRGNIVNAVTDTGERGIQIEQGRSVRDEYGPRVADAVVSLLTDTAPVVS